MGKKSNKHSGPDNVDVIRDPASETPPRAEVAGAAAPTAGVESNGVAAPAVAGSDLPEIRIDPDFQKLIPPLSEEEQALLEESLLREHGPREPLVVWRETGFLLDGHHRLDICRKRNLPFSVREIALPDREAAIAWIDKNQDGRRNLTPEGMSYRRGRRYLVEKKQHGGRRTRKKTSGQNDHMRTEERLADLFKVGTKTIRRDAAFAEAVDRLASSCGEEVRRYILTRRPKGSQGALVKLSQMELADRRKAVERLLVTGKIPATRASGKPRSPSLPNEPDALAKYLVRNWDAEKLDQFRKAVTDAKRKRDKEEPYPYFGAR